MLIDSLTPEDMSRLGQALAEGVTGIIVEQDVEANFGK